MTSEPGPTGGPTRFDCAAEIFHELRALGLLERDERLSVLCKGDTELEAMVRLLLKGDNAPLRAEGLADQIKAASDAVTAGLTADLVATWIGHYKLLERIGEGGFGVVYLAEQDQPVRRRVALKIIKLGMDTRQVVARFEAERQALAIMDHPNIAKVFDGGATDTGRPYFVMELVKGVPITEYCDEYKLDVTARLTLFRHVCDALQHAHQKGVIHRDIKPSNVLVSEIDGKPVPKVIDFGIAKATSAHLTEKTIFTEHRQMIGTPEYMSPEQAGAPSLDIDTRTDVYALGVLLYELLTGATPFDSSRLRSAAYGEIQRIIREEDPPRPSTRLTSHESRASIAAARGIEPARLTSQLSGELDWVVMKCLEKDRARRYDSASSLMQDIGRFLSGETVLAVPPSMSYRVGKLVRRNKGPVIAATAVLLVLIAGLIGTSLGFWNAENQRTRADEEAKEAREQRSFAERRSYITTINLAVNSIETAQPGRAAFLLDQCAPERRDWEWHHARSRLNQSVRCINQSTVPGILGTTVRVTPDGKLILAAVSGPGSPRYGMVLIDPDTGLEVRRMYGHTGAVNSIRLDPTGALALTASADGSARIFRIADGQEIAVPLRVDRPLHYAEFDQSGARVLVLIDAVHPRPSHAVVCNSDGSGAIGTPIEGVITSCFEPGSSRVIVSRGFQPPQARDILGGEIEALHPEQSGGAWTNANGELLASESRDAVIRLIERPTGRVRASLRGHWAKPHGVEFDHDRGLVYSCAEDLTIRTWSSVTGDPLRTFLGHTQTVFDIAAATDGRRLFSAGPDGIRVWHTDPADDGLVLLRSTNRAVSGLCYSPDGTLLATAAEDGLHLWNATTHQRIRTLLSDSPRMCEFSGDGKWLVATTWSDRLFVWNVHSSEQLRAPFPLQDGVCELAVNHDGTRIAVAFWGREGLLLDENGKEIPGFKGLDPVGRALTFLPGSNELVAELPRGGVFARWDATTGSRLPHSPVVARVVRSMQVLPDGNWLLACERDQVSIYNPSDGSTVRSFKGHAAFVRGAAMLPGGSRLITTARDGTIRVCDVESGDEVVSFKTMHALPEILAVNPVTGSVAVAFEDRHVQLFHAPR